jgi:ribosomal-protein-alanine N-acetyltransferase
MKSSQQERAAFHSDMVSSLRIRSMRLEDLPAVLAIDRLSFPLPWPESSFRYELLENPRSLLRVAEIQQMDEDWQVIGEIVVWLILDEAHIATIAVHPDFRGIGIAKVLLANVLAESIQKGIRQATLEVRDSNLIARKLYQRFGFQLVGSRPHYYKDNDEDALLMTVSGLNDHTLKWLESGGWQSTKAGDME